MPRRILVLQHLDVEHPGVFRDFFAADGIDWDVAELDQGEALPALDGYDALWAMGGPMDVWEEEEHPWLRSEKAFIRRAVVDHEMPFMGICLGHQLLAAALGGEVTRAARAEVGVLNVSLTAAGGCSPFCAGLPERFACLQWHGAEVRNAPAGARILASSPDCGIQALAVGDKAFSAQFHLEITACTLDEWHAIPAYRTALASTLGSDGFDRFKADADAHMAQFMVHARAVYDNWRAAAFS